MVSVFLAGRILLKGDNITLMMNTDVMPYLQPLLLQCQLLANSFSLLGIGVHVNSVCCQKSINEGLCTNTSAGISKDKIYAEMLNSMICTVPVTLWENFLQAFDTPLHLHLISNMHLVICLYGI